MIDPEEIAKWESEAAEVIALYRQRQTIRGPLFSLLVSAAAIIKALGDALDQESAREVRDESMITALRDEVFLLKRELAAKEVRQRTPMAKMPGMFQMYFDDGGLYAGEPCVTIGVIAGRVSIETAGIISFTGVEVDKVCDELQRQKSQALQ